MGFKKARPNYAWLLTGRVIRRSEYGSTECSILREPFAWRASPVRRSRLRSSSDLRRVGSDGFPRLITAWSSVASVTPHLYILRARMMNLLGAEPTKLKG